MEEKSLLEKLMYIQTTLKAPKGQYNDYGRYSYRSCEDILEAVKPILKEIGATLLLHDELVMIGERYYVRATATLIDKNGQIENVSYAREEETKKGMDGSQITGASSSYARKYALNGLFLIDDVKDSDTTNKGKETDTKSNEKDKQDKLEKFVKVKLLMEKAQIGWEQILETYKVEHSEDLTIKQLDNLISRLNATIKKGEK